MNQITYKRFPLIPRKRSLELLLEKIVLDKRFFVFLGILVLVVAGIFWRQELFLLGERARDFLLSQKEIFLSGISFRFEKPLDLEEEPLEITLPEIVEEPVSEEEVLAEEPRVEEEPPLEEQEQVILPLAKEKCELSLSDIEEQVNGISAKVEVISQEVAELVEASGKEIVVEEPPLAPGEETETELQLAKIQEQINEITAKVEIISQEVAKLVKA